MLLSLDFRKERQIADDEHTDAHSVTCPVCGGIISIANQAELINQIQVHARDGQHPRPYVLGARFRLPPSGSAQPAGKLSVSIGVEGGS
jgi:hypothetical protein